MRESLAIHLDNVSKIYQLHGNQRDQLIHVFGLEKIGLKPRHPATEHAALKDVSLEVPRGHRIGIVGRNGAGKTTLLKLLCGNFTPTNGTVVVNGTIQALMGMGTGFHPEYTGRENAEASLQYNGLARDEYEEAMEGIIEFCELDEYLDQPFKTYSLGMQARLMFATSTAIKPDILIVDEVMGAGDAYFIAKSKARVEKLVDSGCTMLLVSHSMPQVLELCNEAIWLDQGQIRMQDESFLTVKAYEEYLHGPIASVSPPLIKADLEASEDTEEKSCISQSHSNAMAFRPADMLEEIVLQEPYFFPHRHSVNLPSISRPKDFKFVAPGGVSRWDSSVDGLKVCGFTIVNNHGETNKLMSMQPAKFVVTLIAEHDGEFNCRYATNIYDQKGQSIMSVKSPLDSFAVLSNQLRMVEICFNPLQLGPGEYIISISVHQYEQLEVFNATPKYDLLSRSFTLTVEIPESLSALQSQFFHSAEWSFEHLNAKDG